MEFLGDILKGSTVLNEDHSNLIDKRNSLVNTLQAQRRTFNYEQQSDNPNLEILEILEPEIMMIETRLQIIDEEIMKLGNIF